MALSMDRPRIITSKENETNPNYGWFGFSNGTEQIIVRSRLVGAEYEARKLLAQFEANHADFSPLVDGEPLVIVS
jgi:hypothetical protein